MRTLPELRTHRSTAATRDATTLLYNTFPQYLIIGTIFEKKVTEPKCVLIFFTTFSDTFLILRRTGRDMIKNVYQSSYKVPAVLV